MIRWTGNEKLLIGPPEPPDPATPWRILLVMVCAAAIVTAFMTYRLGRYDERIVQAQLTYDREATNLGRCMASFNGLDVQASNALEHIARDHEVIESFLGMHPRAVQTFVADAH